MIKARIIKSSKRIFDCQLADTNEVVQAVAHNAIFKTEGHLVVGDFVELKFDSQSNQYELIDLLPRKNSIHRKIVRENKIKVLASNIDVLLIVSAVSKPDYKSALVDRYLIRSEQWEVPAIVIFNKMDEFDDQFDLEFERKKFDFLNVKTFLTTSHQDTSSEVDDLKAFLKGKTAILLGQSGVGKSALINTLSNGKVELTTGRLAKKVQKGSHTTTWSEVVDCGDFQLIDSPGVRSMSVNDITQEELIHFFPDLHPFIEACQFTNCRHEENSKGCGFGELDPEVERDLFILDRLFSYQRIRDEIEAIPGWQRD